MTKEQYRCMNKKCGIVIESPINRDGIKCPICNSPVFPEPYDSKIEHVPYIPTRVKNSCSHRYKLLRSKAKETYFANDGIYSEKLQAIFFCEKCLHVETRTGQLIDGKLIWEC